jgi:MOSC domain-containing protein
MAMTITAIYRYPVKGLSAEPLERVSLMPGDCLPQDRRFAIALASTRFDPGAPQWLAKTHFVMLMRDEKLARLKTRFDPATGELTIQDASASPGRAGTIALRASLDEPEGRRSVGEFLADFLGPLVERPLRIVEATGHAFADSRRKPNATTDKYVSLINRASIAALEGVVGAPVDPLRFRANLYFAGAPAWSELGWIGGEIAVGGARLRVIAAITRCAATEVNPATAERDLDIPTALQRHFGHNLMGVYAEVVAAGDIATGDQLIEQEQ